MTEQILEPTGEVRYFSTKAVAGFLTGYNTIGNKKEIEELKAYLLPDELRAELRWNDKLDQRLSEDQIDTLLKFELYRQEDARKKPANGTPLQALRGTVRKAEQDLAEGKPLPKPISETAAEYTKWLSSNYAQGIPVRPLDESVYAMRGIPAKDIVYMMDHAELESLVKDFNLPTAESGKSDLLLKTRENELKRAMDKRTPVDGVDERDTLELQRKLPDTLVPFAKQVLALAYKNDLPVLPQKMSSSIYHTMDDEGPRSGYILVIEGSDYTLSALKKQLDPFKEIIARSTIPPVQSLSLTTELEVLEGGESRRLKPAILTIKGSALTDPHFMLMMREAIEKQGAVRERG